MSTSTKPLKTRWWKGPRGEWYVVAQFILFALIAWGRRNVSGLSWPISGAVSSIAGIVLMALGLALSIAAALNLGANLTPLPHPKDDASLVVSGPYRLVRHPMYGGVILLALGWSVYVEGLLTLAYTALTILFFDIKTRREERWLMQRFPAYAAYRTRVRKLIPFIY
jgi:protein-S-isoprenylcysteine O-methyltransferase Ste14